MPRLDSPFLLSPVFKPKIWGRRDLGPLFARPRESAGGDELMGEVWITDDASRFLNGPLSGMALSEASQEFGPELNGSGWKESRFPILAKYIYTSDWLSVQVHPDDEAARRYDPGNWGKTELWYIVRTNRQAKILLGLKRGVTKESLRAAFEKGRSREFLDVFRPRSGEAIFVPPGTVHALGPGLVLFEVEQNSDLTYRLDDYGRVGLDGRPRPLHLDKGLEVTRVELPACRDLPELRFREPYGLRRFVLACRHFALEELTLRKRGTFRGRPERVEILTLLEGEGRVETDGGWFGYQPGHTWLIPPATAKYRLVPRVRTRLLKLYVPDLERDFLRPLQKRGAKAAKLNRIVFD
jgi:mannose-6-phosphate isomerase